MKTLTTSFILLLASIHSSFAEINGSLISDLEVIGIMRCFPAANIGPDYHDMYGCQSSIGPLSFRQFFEKYRRDKSLQIIKIGYSGFQNLYHIYYGNPKGLPFMDEYY